MNPAEIWQKEHIMTFMEAVTTCIGKKYFTMKGRASRSELWWYVFFYSICTCILMNISPMVGGIAWIFFFIPDVCVRTRRLHDINMSGWWQLLFPWGIAAISGFISGLAHNDIILSVGTIIAIVSTLILFCRKGSNEENRFGPPAK